MSLQVGESLLDWAVASRTHPDQAESGDRYVVAPRACGALLGAVDGLGHGAEAAEAACLAVRLLEAHRDESVSDLVQRCHAALAATRGVVLSLASYDASDQTLSWIGVGNVEGVVSRRDRSRQTLLLRAGVVGYHVPELHASVVSVSPGDTLVFATDGILSGWHLDPGEAPGQTADRILAGHAAPRDDALVLVVRFAGVER